MIHVEQYARDRWDVWGEGITEFTVMARDRDEALRRAMDRIADVDARAR